jgi:DNA-binding transcriptional LysR family regulator
MERLDLRLVEYFIAVAEELHFGRAAERLHIAQPSLSQQIRRLEGQLGVALLTRNSRRVELTDAGVALLREGRKALSQSRRAIQATRAAADATVTVGFYGSAGRDLLPLILREFTGRHPSSAVSVRELPLGSIEDVLGGAVDLAFTRLSPGQTELEVEVLGAEPRVVALPSAHPLAHHDSLRFVDLRGEEFITNPAEAAEGPRPPRWLAEQRRHGLPGRATAQSRAIAEILTLVAAQRGVCLVPFAVARHYPRSDVSYVPVEDAERALVSLAWRRGSLSPPAKDFIETVRSVARRAAQPWPTRRVAR